MKTAAKKINLLFSVIGLGLGGSERVVLDLIQNMDKTRFNVYLAYFAGGALFNLYSDACIKMFDLKKKPGLDIGTIRKLTGIIAEYDIDVINAHHYTPFLYSYLASKIFHNRVFIFTQHSVKEVNTIAPKYKFFCNLAFFRTDAVIGVSKEIRSSLQKTYPIHSNKILCVPNAVNVDRFIISVKRDQVRSELGILPSNFVIGTVANFRKVKNHVCLIKAFDRIAEAYPEARLLFVGRGFANAPQDSEKEIKRLIKSLGLTERVIFAGYRDDVSKLLKAMDIFCLPSLAEGLPVSVLESMASGVPFIGSDVSGIREVVSSGETGLLFPSNDDRLLAEALEKLIENPSLRSKLAKRAFDFVRQEHGIDQWIDRYELLFGSIQT